MKNFTILVAVFLLSVGSSFSQGDPTFGETGNSGSYLKKGNMYFGGMLGFTFEKQKHEDSNGSSDGPKTTKIDILPTAGYVISDKTAVGLSLGYTSLSEKRFEFDFNSGQEFELQNKSSQFIVSPFSAFYKGLSDDFFAMLYCYGLFGFGNQKDEFLSGDEIFKNEFKKNSWELGVSPGFKWFPTDRLSIGFSYGKVFWGGETLKDKEDSNLKWKTSGGGIDLDPSTARVGINYWISPGF